MTKRTKQRFLWAFSLYILLGAVPGIIFIFKELIG